MAELDDAAAGHGEVADTPGGRHRGDRRRDADYGVEPTDDVGGRLGELGAGDVVLVKASRAGGLERVVADLVAVDEPGG